MVTILHTADVHLDRVFAGLGMSQGVAATRREELRDAIRRLVNLASEIGADAVTVGGDLFEHERVTLDTGHFLRQQFERLDPIRVLIAPGNHDPYAPDSLYRRIEWPANVTIFDCPEFRPIEVTSGVTVWGAGHNGPTLRRNLLEGFKVRGPGLHVLLFHGSDVQNVPEGKPAHCPFVAADVEATGADFALLGHYHTGRLNSSFAYPGSPEPLDFSEGGQHYVLRVDVSVAGINPILVPFSRVTYSTQRIDVTGMASSDQLRGAISRVAGAGGVVRVLLEGELSPEIELDVEALYNACAENCAFLDIVDRTQPGYDFELLAEESTTKGVFVKLMLARIQNAMADEVEVDREALVLGLRAFDKRELSA